MKKKYHKHYIFKPKTKDNEIIQKIHLISINHKEKYTKTRHCREIEIYNAFGKHTYNF